MPSLDLSFESARRQEKFKTLGRIVLKNPENFSID